MSCGEEGCLASEGNPAPGFGLKEDMRKDEKIDGDEGGERGGHYHRRGGVCEI